MDIDPKDSGLIIKAASFVAAGAAGIAVGRYKLVDLTKRVTALESGKVDKADCSAIQKAHGDKFTDGTDQFKELKDLIKESNELHQRHHDDLMKIVVENLRQ